MTGLIFSVIQKIFVALQGIYKVHVQHNYIIHTIVTRLQI